MATPINITPEHITNDNGERTGVIVMHFEGQLDESTADDEARVMYSLIDDAPDGAHVILDLSGLTYMNSKSIGYLTDWHARLQHKGGSIAVAETPGNIQDILDLVGLTKIVPLYGSVEEALKANSNNDE